MDVARVVNEDEEPRPILEAVPEAQEVVDSTALEEELGIEDGDDEDAGGEPDDFIEEDEGPDSVDELLDDDQ